MIVKTRQGKLLKKYGEKIKNIGDYCNNSKLKIEHKKRFNLFFGRAIEYCENHKIINYESSDRSYKNAPYTKAQKVVYEKVLAEIIKLQREIMTDDELKLKHKQQLCKCLSYTVGHLRGRLKKKFI